MTINTDTLFGKLSDAGKALEGDVWSAIKLYALPELHKIAVQVEAIATHLTEYTPEGAKALFEMQVKASIGVIVAMTSLVMLAVQDAINAILDTVRGFVNGAIGFPLI